VERIIKNYDERNTLIAHNTEENIEKTIEIGTWAGLAFIAHIELSSGRAIKILSKYRTEHVMINRPADRGHICLTKNGSLAGERRKKESASSILTCDFYNGYEFYKQSPQTG
jgi:predicted metal-dependent TIM-barrel fold hydrolase